MLPSSARVDKKKANLIDAIVALVREKIPKATASQVESFVRQYYAGVAPEESRRRQCGGSLRRRDFALEPAPQAGAWYSHDPHLQSESPRARLAVHPYHYRDHH